MPCGDYQHQKHNKMKILSFLIIAVTMLSSWGISDGNGVITMTTSAECLRFGLMGSGIAIVDWGDGSKKDTVKLELVGEDGWSRIRRTNLDTTHRTITITGKNITGLDCDAKFIISYVDRKPPACNQITGLDVSRNAALTYLECGRNRLTKLDVSKNAALKKLSCIDNQLTELDVSKNTVLTWLGCARNQLTELDVSKNTALTGLSCGRNQLTELDVSKNTALKILECSDNPLTALNVSRNTALEDMACSNIQLTELDISRNTALEHLICFDNPLTALDVSRHAALKELRCDNIQLTALDVSRNTSLVVLSCNGNQLTADALNLLLGMLHDNIVMILDTDGGEQIATKIINISNNPGSADCDRSIAERKGWIME